MFSFAFERKLWALIFPPVSLHESGWPFWAERNTLQPAHIHHIWSFPCFHRLSHFEWDWLSGIYQEIIVFCWNFGNHLVNSSRSPLNLAGLSGLEYCKPLTIPIQEFETFLVASELLFSWWIVVLTQLTPGLRKILKILSCRKFRFCIFNFPGYVVPNTVGMSTL